MMLGNFQCRGVVLILIIVEKRPTVLSEGTDRGCLYCFLSSAISLFLSPSLWEMAKQRLKYCLKGSLNEKKKKKKKKPICQKM